MHPAERHVVELASGVIWERLTSHQHEDVDFLHVIYDVGGSSAPDERLMRHSGREYGYVLSGRLGVQLGFERHELGPGDSIAFDSTTPTDSGTSATKPCTGLVRCRTIGMIVSGGGRGGIRTHVRVAP